MLNSILNILAFIMAKKFLFISLQLSSLPQALHKKKGLSLRETPALGAIAYM